LSAPATNTGKRCEGSQRHRRIDLQHGHASGDSAWTRLQDLPDRLLFGPEAEQEGLRGRLRRAARYPYALIRDLLGGKLTLHAMGLVYTSLLAIVPLLAFSFGILKAFHAQSALEPLVHEFFRPMGSAADDLTARTMEFANKVRGDLVGSVGLVLLIWTLLGTMKKVEDAFNFIWHVDVPRSFARRMGEYLALLITGPMLLAALIGLSHLAAGSVPMKLLSQLPLAARLTALSVELAPFVVVSALLTALYVGIPNTRVRISSGLAGGVSAGIIWAAIGRFFTAFVVYSTRLTVVYAGLAIIVAALVWTYFNWIILLLGARVSFYAQNPNYLRLGLNELRLSCLDTERLALSIMYLIAERYRLGAARLSVSDLAALLGYPEIAVARLIHTLESARLLAATEDATLLPARDIGQIQLLDVVTVARTSSSGLVRTSSGIPSVVRQFCDEMDQTWRVHCAGVTLSDLIERERETREQPIIGVKQDR
jgi:membrane protein